MGTLDPKTKTLLQRLMALDTDEQFEEGDIEAFFENPGLWRQLLHGKPISPENILVDRRWWMLFVLTYMGGRGDVSKVPHINGKQQRSLERYNFQILNSLYGRGYHCPETFQFPTKEEAWHPWDYNHPQNCWMGVENIPLPNKGEHYADDRLCADLGLKSRLGHSWQEVNEQILPRVAELMGFEPKRVSLMSWEEWSWFGNLLNYINNFLDESFVPFVQRWLEGSDVVEWCKNTWREDQHVSFHSARTENVAVGYTCMGSLDKLVNGYRLPSLERVGFRVIIRFDKHL